MCLNTDDSIDGFKRKFGGRGRLLFCRVSPHGDDKQVLLLFMLIVSLTGVLT
jgi:hypothetical protein